jgi:hypothetical protein
MNRQQLNIPYFKVWDYRHVLAKAANITNTLKNSNYEKAGFIYARIA